MIRIKNKKLVASRNILGLTQEKIAIKLGIAKATYNLKENGKRHFNEKEMVLISELLGKSMDYLFFTKEVNINDTNRREI
ncbi:helix-turn-helix transcriptional regulator [Metaclostridioides mangenotii]|uniref:helix-turn-helix transcriptional regulator n=1 Tax=Metaclostridioides mangenotii TaxID=1540 RepID=UPI002ED11434